ncbi:helix-turn-helix domain-containing protein [Limosilactobacillus kribbianus]|uniref:helix-turn-helix domain-containing protein n=1 Tax=Limosilactobacillus kribbianus TaxID=2982695 RepID=UPI0022646C69|nr:AraC family transcriptional regulator [Limosilactobacillus kribbianus]
MDFHELENVDYSFSDYPVLIEYTNLSSYPDFRAINHWHDDFEFTYIFAGQMNYNVNGTIITLSKGNGIFVNSKQMHFGFNSNHQDCLFLCVVFKPTLLCINSAFEEEYVKPIINNGVPFLKLSEQNPLQKKILLSLLTLKDPAQSKLAIQARLFAIWNDLYQLLPKFSQNALGKSADFSLLKRVLIFIESNYQNRLTLADLVKEFSISKSKIIKLFNRYLQQTPIEYLNSFRIKKACQLLTSTELTITEISFKVGFNDSSYFAKTFKQKMRETAREYRKDH